MCWQCCSPTLTWTRFRTYWWENDFLVLICAPLWFDFSQASNIRPVLKSSNRAFDEFSAASTTFWDNRPLAPTRRYRNRCVLAAFLPVFANLGLSKPWRAHHKEPTGFCFWLHLRGTDVIFHVPMQRAVAISMEQIDKTWLPRPYQPSSPTPHS